MLTPEEDRQRNASTAIVAAVLPPTSSSPATAARYSTRLTSSDTLRKPRPTAVPQPQQCSTAERSLRGRPQLFQAASCSAASESLAQRHLRRSRDAARLQPAVETRQAHCAYLSYSSRASSRPRAPTAVAADHAFRLRFVRWHTDHGSSSRTSPSGSSAAAGSRSHATTPTCVPLTRPPPRRHPRTAIAIRR